MNKQTKNAMIIGGTLLTIAVAGHLIVDAIEVEDSVEETPIEEVEESNE